jgi:hypothetical protein
VNWISFKEKVPTEGIPILVSDLNRGIATIVGAFVRDKKYKTWLTSASRLELESVNNKEITHWMYVSDALLPKCTGCKDIR